MKKSLTILQINSLNFGSTGNIMLSIDKKLQEHGHNSMVAYANSRSNKNKNLDNSILIGGIVERNLHIQLASYTGLNGRFSTFGTKRLLKKIDKIKPNIIHLHNLHNCYINLEVLFNYIKEKNISVVWTLHDCWAFTGQCPHFTYVECDKWKTGCFECPQFREYPSTRIDKTKVMYDLKKTWFTGLKNLTIVTPSFWLAEKVKSSYLNEYPIRVINNGINLDIFKPTHSDFRRNYNLSNKKVILGVANPWTKKKGLDIFIELANRLDDSYKIVLVGLTTNQLKSIPNNILGLARTSDQYKLAEIYSSADYFINPSIEETMGMVTLEAIACGTPVIVSNFTAVPEMVTEKCGLIVKDYTSEAFYKAIISNPKYEKENLLNWAEKFELNKKYDEYLDLYEAF